MNKNREIAKKHYAWRETEKAKLKATKEKEEKNN